MKKYPLKNDTLTETDLKNINNFSVYPRFSIKTTDKRFVNIEKNIGGRESLDLFLHES